jgi:diguanylate cyclase (GGDEF)-like protein
MESIFKSKNYSLRFNSNSRNKVTELGNSVNTILDAVNAEAEKNRKSTQRLMETQVSLGRLSQYDSLTGLPNRRYFMETLERAFAQFKRSGEQIALMYLDLDGFKEINDAHGHKVGDELLQCVANKAKSLIRQGDMIARLGGDEFLILLYNHPDESLLQEIASRMSSELSQPYHIQAWQLQVSVSIGISIISEEDADVSEFINNADIAMYRSKREGLSKTTIYAPFMRSENKRKLEIANALDDAITHDEFHLVYQAKVDSEERIVGYEALIRWNSESLGFIPPDEFIEIAEQSGKIHMITLWVGEQICKDMPLFLKQHGKQIRVSFNLSVYDLQDPKLSETLNSMFEKYQVSGRNIELEITEYAYLNNFDMANTFFDDMAKIDCTIALDDFGTGYSSLGYLTKININTLKIDKQFISDTAQSSKSMLVTKAIIEMAKQLGLDVCAEGVETIEQANFLKQSGCHLLQGYLYSKPMPVQSLFDSQSEVS